MHLLLIRHGQSAANVAGILETRAPGPGLTALGTVSGWTITSWSANALGGAHLDGPKSKDVTGHHPL